MFNLIYLQSDYVFAETVENIKTIEIVFKPQNVMDPIEVEELSVHACGEVTTTTAAMTRMFQKHIQSITLSMFQSLQL